MTHGNDPNNNNFSNSTPGLTPGTPNTLNPTIGANMLGGLPQRTVQTDPFLNEASQANTKGGLMMACAIGAGLMVLGVGLLAKTVFGRASALMPQVAAAETAPATNYFTEQQRLMREAMDMAREAQAMQKERMAQMKEMWEREQETGDSFGALSESGGGGSGSGGEN